MQEFPCLELLIGEGVFLDTNKQEKLSRGVLELRELALKAWEKVDADAEFKSSFTKISQAISNQYAEFLGKLTCYPEAD